MPTNRISLVHGRGLFNSPPITRGNAGSHSIRGAPKAGRSPHTHQNIEVVTNIKTMTVLEMRIPFSRYQFLNRRPMGLPNITPIPERKPPIFQTRSANLACLPTSNCRHSITIIPAISIPPTGRNRPLMSFPWANTARTPTKKYPPKWSKLLNHALGFPRFHEFISSAFSLISCHEIVSLNGVRLAATITINASANQSLAHSGASHAGYFGFAS